MAGPTKRLTAKKISSQKISEHRKLESAGTQDVFKGNLIVTFQPQRENPTADFDTSNPKSIVNLVPQFIKQHLSSINFFDDEKTTEELLEEELGPDAENPKRIYFNRCHIQFWDEYDLACREDRTMSLDNVLYRLGNVTFFKTTIVERPKMLAALLKPPVQYELNLKELHALGLTAMRRALTCNPITNGQPNVKLIEAQTKITQILDMRIKGAVVQRIEQKNLNVNVDAGRKPGQTAAAPRSIEEIENEILRLEAKSKELESPGFVTVNLMKDVSQPVERIIEDNAQGQKEDSSTA